MSVRISLTDPDAETVAIVLAWAAEIMEEHAYDLERGDSWASDEDLEEFRAEAKELRHKIAVSRTVADRIAMKVPS